VGFGGINFAGGGTAGGRGIGGNGAGCRSTEHGCTHSEAHTHKLTYEIMAD